MGNRTEHKKFLDSLKKQGFELDFARNGHIRVTNPETGESLLIAATPGEYRSVLNTKMRLKRRLGYDPRK